MATCVLTDQQNMHAAAFIEGFSQGTNASIDVSAIEHEKGESTPINLCIASLTFLVVMRRGLLHQLNN